MNPTLIIALVQGMLELIKAHNAGHATDDDLASATAALSAFQQKAATTDAAADTAAEQALEEKP